MRIVIIGTGLAGQLVLRDLRKNGFEGQVTMLTVHRGDFYSKPSLSNVQTQGKKPQDLILMSRERIEQQFRCEVVASEEIQSIDTDKKEVCSEREVYPYDKLVLALGSEPRVQAWMPQSDRIFRVNHLEDYEPFLKAVQQYESMAIIGGGLIGVEFANDFSQSMQIKLIEAEPTLMSNQLPAEMGHAIQKHLEQQGVDVYVNQSINGINDQNGLQIALNEHNITTDMALAAVGLAPNTELATAAGLRVNVGIEVDQYGQTSNPDIFALGDCAQVCGLLRFYVAPLKICAEAIAKNITGLSEKIHYPPLPVMLKMPSYPVCFCFNQLPSEWEVTKYEDGIEALAYSGSQLVGFAVSGSQMSKRMGLKKLMKDWI